MEALTDYQLYLGLGGALVVAGLIEAVKRASGLTDDKWTRWVPLVALGLGGLWSALVLTLGPAEYLRWNIIVFLGIFTGLSAVGLYSGQKAMRGR